MCVIFLKRHALRIHGDLRYITTVTDFLDIIALFPYLKTTFRRQTPYPCLVGRAGPYKNRTMDNVQEVNNCINISSSQTFIP
jgi:hypothetical protein